jgi:hypothetical protein
MAGNMTVANTAFLRQPHVKRVVSTRIGRSFNNRGLTVPFTGALYPLLSTIRSRLLDAWCGCSRLGWSHRRIDPLLLLEECPA